MSARHSCQHRRHLELFCLTILLPVAPLLTGCNSTARLEVVSGFDADRYLGVWYEAARYPHGFEKNLSSVSAEYSRNDDGTIKVVNRGFNDKTQEWKEIEGVAKLKGDADRGWLKVSFFKPFYASYKIVHLDVDYTEAIVAGPTFGYCWILVRDPALPATRLDALVAKATALGFEKDKLLLVDQSKQKPQ